MQATPEQIDDFAKGYQDQHDDMFEDLRQHFKACQLVIIEKDFKAVNDFDDLGRDFFLSKLEQYCKQARTARAMQGLCNTYEK